MRVRPSAGLDWQREAETISAQARLSVLLLYAHQFHSSNDHVVINVPKTCLKPSFPSGSIRNPVHKLNTANLTLP